LLLALRLDADLNLRRLVWSELLGGNLLRLLTPPKDFPNILSINCTCKEETNKEVLDCMITAIAKRALSKASNRFLYEIVMEQLRRYIWKSQGKCEKMSWERKDALERIILGSFSKDVYTDLCKVDVDRGDTVSSSSPELERLEIIKNFARNEHQLAKKLAKDGIEF